MAGDTLYVSGQIAIEPYTGKLVDDNIKSETEQVLKNIIAILKEVEMTLHNVVKVSIFLSDMAIYGEVNEVYGKYLGESLPAREAIAAKGLPMGVNVEMSCIAVKL